MELALAQAKLYIYKKNTNVDKNVHTGAQALKQRKNKSSVYKELSTWLKACTSLYETDQYNWSISVFSVSARNAHLSSPVWVVEL